MRLPAGQMRKWGSISENTQIFLYVTVSRPSVQQTQPPIEWVPSISPGVKRPGIKADHLHFTGEFKNACNHTVTPPCVDDRVFN